LGRFPATDHPPFKRGGNAPRVPLDDVLLGAPGRGIDIQALDEALESLAKIDGRKARVVGVRSSDSIDHRISDGTKHAYEHVLQTRK
jgi:hypothetical protein